MKNQKNIQLGPGGVTRGQISVEATVKHRSQTLLFLNYCKSKGWSITTVKNILNTNNYTILTKTLLFLSIHFALTLNTCNWTKYVVNGGSKLLKTSFLQYCFVPYLFVSVSCFDEQRHGDTALVFSSFPVPSTFFFVHLFVLLEKKAFLSLPDFHPKQKALASFICINTAFSLPPHHHHILHISPLEAQDKYSERLQQTPISSAICWELVHQASSNRNNSNLTDDIKAQECFCFNAVSQRITDVTWCPEKRRSNGKLWHRQTFWFLVQPT